MKKLLLSIVLLTCAFQFSDAQKIDSIVRAAATKFVASGPRVGFSIGVIKNGIVYRYNFGNFQRGGKIPPTDQTIYEIGSVTKTFTSLLLAKAVIEKKVKFNDDIRKYLKGNYPNLQYEGKPIQLLHLANLTSGLPNNLPENMPDMKTMNPDSQIFKIRNFHNAYSKNHFLADLHSVKLTVSPGLNPAHSNTAAQLLGFILENIYGAKYEVLLKKYITDPLKMKNTFVFVPVSKKLAYASGYNDKGLNMPEIPKDAGGAELLKSSLNDMIIFTKNQLEENDKKILISHKPRWGKPEIYAVGLSWSIKINFDGKTKIWTSGGTFGQSSYVSFYPGRKFGVVILSNESDNAAEDRLSDVAQNIYNEIYFTPVQRSSEGFGFSTSVNLLLDSLNKHGFNKAIEITRTLKKHDLSFNLFEDEVNSWGYNFFFKGQKAKALEIFKLNVSLYPNSANTYDSLAETYEDMGNKEAAIQNFKQELKLNPNNTDVFNHLKKLEKK